MDFVRAPSTRPSEMKSLSAAVAATLAGHLPGLVDIVSRSSSSLRHQRSTHPRDNVIHYGAHRDAPGFVRVLRQYNVHEQQKRGETMIRLLRFIYVCPTDRETAVILWYNRISRSGQENIASVPNRSSRCCDSEIIKLNIYQFKREIHLNSKYNLILKYNCEHFKRTDYDLCTILSYSSVYDSLSGVVRGRGV